MAFLDATGNQFKQGISTIKNLNPALLAKVDKAQIVGTLDDVIADNTAGNPASAQAVKSLDDKTNLNTQKIEAIIDDGATTGDSKTWSVDQIKTYIAQEDDTYFAATLDERDDDAVGIVVPKRQGVRVFVADASADPDVGTDTDGTAFGAHYIYNSSVWLLIRTLQYRQVDVTPYVRYDDVVDSLDSIETTKPLSANQGRELIDLINGGVGSLVMAVDDTTVLTGGVIELTKIAKGEATNGMALVVVDEGIIPVFVTMAADGKSATIIADDVTIFETKTVRISYLTDGTASGNTGDGGGDGDAGSI